MGAWDVNGRWQASGGWSSSGVWDSGNANASVTPVTWTFVLIPDSQTFIQYDKVERFQDQIDWIVANKESANIKHVAHVGDVIHSYSIPGTSEPHWVSVEDVMDDLETANIPYSVTVGNHDYLQSTRDSTMFNSYFPLSKFTGFSTYGGAAETGKSENTWWEFRVGNIDWLVISIEFGPRDSILTWANSVVTAHPDHKVIVVAHAYLSKDGERFISSTNHSPDNGYGLGSDVNNGQEMWDNFVKLHENILMVLCGHDGDSSPEVVSARLDSVGNNGNKVFQMMFNYQYVHPNDGRMMIMEIVQDSYITVNINAYNATTNSISTDPVQSFTISEGPLVSITSPSDGSSTNDNPVAVAWTVDGVAQVTELTEPLSEGSNTITRSYTDGEGRTGTDSISVTLDTVAPVVVITSPADAAELTESPVAVAWTVDGVAQNTDLFENLVEGSNTITRTATDAAGNVGSDSVTVSYTAGAPFVPSDDPACYAWYRTGNASTTTVTGNNIDTKASELGSNYTLSDNGTTQPQNTGSLNGKTIFEYDGSCGLGRGGTYNATTNPYIVNGSFHLIMLFRIDSGDVSATTDGLLRIDTATGFAVVPNSTTQFLGRISAYGIGFTSTNFNAGSNLADSNYHLLRIVANAGDSTFKVWVDGTLRLSISTYNGAIQTTDFNLFLGRSAGYYMGGGHGDVIFTTDLSDLIYTSHKTYINSEFGTAF